MIGLLLLSRVVVRTAPFFLPDAHTMMTTILAQRPRLSRLRRRLKVTPQPYLHGLAAPAAAADAAGAAAGAAGASPAAAATATVAAGLIIDVNDFTTWTLDTWALLDWDSIAFPSDPAVNIASVTGRYNLAAAMILWYQADLREKHKRLWDELNYAWLATFSCDLHAVGWEKWPRTGLFRFDEVQCKWLTETLCFLKQSAGRIRRVSAPPRAPEIAPEIVSASAGKRKRNSGDAEGKKVHLL